MPPSHQNLISNKNFGLYLSIDTKNSPLNSVLLPKNVAESRTLPLKNFQAKKSRNFKFWPTDALYISKESWEQVQFRFSKKKYNFVQKNIFFFHFFDFRGIIRAVRKFSMSSFSKFSKKNSSNDTTRAWLRCRGTKSGSGSNFGASLWELREINYNHEKKDTPATKELWSKMAFFKWAWQTLKVLPSPWPCTSSKSDIGAFKWGTVWHCTSKGCRITGRQSLNN